MEIVSTDTSQNPKCEHGPSTLFAGGGQIFYACSVYRSRNLCPFYMEFDEWEHRRARFNVAGSSSGVRTSLRPSFSSTATESEPLDSTQGQDSFKRDSDAFLIKIVHDLNIKCLICVGVPKIHKSMFCTLKGRSYLLDINPKLEKFKNFSLYDMCNSNSYFFDEEGKNEYFNFLESCGQEKVAIICDPPSHLTHLELVIGNIHQIQKDLQAATNCRNARANVILIHVCFCEGKILEIDPTLQMCEYKMYGGRKQLRNKSNARIFTDVPLSKIVFPSCEVVADSKDVAVASSCITSGEYKYCGACEKYVLAISEHCNICNCCNSKDEKAHKHCSDCGRCVKKTSVHCPKCKKCHFPRKKGCRAACAALCSEMGEDKRKKKSKLSKAARKKRRVPKWEEKLFPGTKKKSKKQKRSERDSAARKMQAGN